MNKCNNCGAALNQYDYCAFCGVEASNSSKKEVTSSVTNIYHINGDRQAQSPPRYEQKSWTVAFILYICFGALGIHRFYIGKIGTGILYMLTLGFFGIGIVVDFFLLIFNTLTDSKGQKLRR